MNYASLFVSNFSIDNKGMWEREGEGESVRPSLLSEKGLYE
jgi:hypothetical protein